jgi:hypothetical protein
VIAGTRTAAPSIMTTQRLADGGHEMLDDWETLEERLGLPGNARADERAAELTAQGWQLVGVLFQSGVWRFRRPEHHSRQ